NTHFGGWGGRAFLVGLGEAEGVHADEVEDHLAGDRGDPAGARSDQQPGDAVLLGDPVAAVGLYGAVRGVAGRLRGGVLRHVRRLGGTHVVARVVERGRLLGHQPGQLDLDLRLRQRVRDALVGADRGTEDLPLLHVAD